MTDIKDDYDPDEILRDVGEQEIFEENERQISLNEESAVTDVFDDIYRESIEDTDNTSFE
jgi:hypothetical protein